MEKNIEFFYEADGDRCTQVTGMKADRDISIDCHATVIIHSNDSKKYIFPEVKMRELHLLHALNVSFICCISSCFSSIL